MEMVRVASHCMFSPVTHESHVALWNPLLIMSQFRVAPWPRQSPPSPPCPPCPCPLPCVPLSAIPAAVKPATAAIAAALAGVEVGAAAGPDVSPALGSALGFPYASVVEVGGLGVRESGGGEMDRSLLERLSASKVAMRK